MRLVVSEMAELKSILFTGFWEIRASKAGNHVNHIPNILLFEHLQEVIHLLAYYLPPVR